MEKIEWHIKNQNAKYKFSENLSKETSINISKEIFDFLDAKQNGDVVTVILKKRDFLLAFSKMISNLPLYYYKNGSQKADFTSDFFETNYNEIIEHFGEKEEIQYKIKVRINDESTTRYYLYRIDGAKNFIIRDFLIGENSILNFIKDNGEIIIEPIISITGKENTEPGQSPSPKATKPAESYEQIVFYGVPGSGKSYKIDNEKTAGASEYQKQKVVFHPDYTNSDFIGQIIPKMKEIGEGENKKSVIEYSFKPGPFTTILRRALRDKENQYYLLIEEINRGNAAAIFGDLFQLLDRNDDGWSCSPVNNDDINFYIASEYEFWEDGYSDSHTYSFESVNHPDGTSPFSRNTGIQLPPNLSIYATMNTNDQNVFSLDNAFNRRFLSEYISNKENSKNEAHCNQFNLKIGETGIYWGNFRNLINKEIIGSGFINAEDRQLGLFFIKKSRGFDGITEKDFADKVLKYLWHDVFKRDKDIFKDSTEMKIKSFEDLIDNFKGADAFKNCFNSDLVSALNQSNSPLLESPEQLAKSE